MDATDHFAPMRNTSAMVSPGEENRPDAADDDLDKAAQDEHEYLRQRLRDELEREPTEEEMSEWLRRHTEAY
jgi:hypothetical protein